MSSAAVVRNASWQHDSAQLMFVREAVFICEQKVPAELEWDELDAKSWHALAESGCGNPIATGRLTSRGQIGRIAVLPAWRGKGVGGALLDFLLLKAHDGNLRHLFLHAQIRACAFYEKRGFEAVGDHFVEAGIIHVEMRHV